MAINNFSSQFISAYFRDSFRTVSRDVKEDVVVVVARYRVVASEEEDSPIVVSLVALVASAVDNPWENNLQTQITYTLNHH